MKSREQRAKRKKEDEELKVCKVQRLLTQLSIIFCIFEKSKGMDDKVKYWIDLSDYDLDTALAMLKSRRYLYVGFMCHQTIEKIFKAYFTKVKGETAPLSHSLSFLAKKGDLYNDFSEQQKDFIDQIEPLNIEARYPSYKERLLKSLNEQKSMEIFNETKQLQEWIKTKL